ncbi:MAG: hypothetical protein ACRDK4_07370 [Solirubrobacteraceae bacterium]
MLRRRAAALALALCGCALPLALSAPAYASTPGKVAVNVGLHPERLGHSTTIAFSFHIPTNSTRIPTPLTGFDLQLPAGMGLGDSTLGVSTCSAATLLRSGSGACPVDSLMGDGSGIAEAQFGPEIVTEHGFVRSFMTVAKEGHTSLLYYFDGRVPVIAPLVFSSALLAAGDSPISELSTDIPLIPVFPETPDAALVSLSVKLGPEGLTYYKRERAKVVAYTPVGMDVPPRCPTKGFRFTAYFTFADGTRRSSARYVPCPGRRRR